MSWPRAPAATGPLTNAAFQAALRVAKRVATETAIQQKRVSIPSVAVAEFAKSVFERFDDKHVLVIGAGEMGEEALRYLIDEGAQDITHRQSQPGAGRGAGRATGRRSRGRGSELHELLVEADLVVSATGATEPIVTAADFKPIVGRALSAAAADSRPGDSPRLRPGRSATHGRLSLFDRRPARPPASATAASASRNGRKAERIIEEETARFMADLHHRATAPTIKRLKARADEVKADELARLLNKLGTLDPQSRKAKSTAAFDRLVNKLLHPPLESLRDEAQEGAPHGLLDALKRLFKLKD